jgi:multiple sugar transport system permease protein
MTVTAERRPITAASRRSHPERVQSGNRKERGAFWPTAILIAGAVYCLIPLLWVIVASTKSSRELFTTFTFFPGSGLGENLTTLFTYNNGVFFSWILNTLLFAGVGAIVSTGVSGLAGYAFAKFSFRGKGVMFKILLAGVLVPGITLSIPQYFIMANLGLTNTYWAVLLPVLISPFGIFLSRIYAASAVPDEMLEAARIDGANEFTILRRIVFPIMVPGLVTVFMLQFVGIWNNFLLPYLMLSGEDKYPLTVGLFTLMSRGTNEPALHTAVITGAAVSVIPLILLMLWLQRYWKLDLISGGLKG